MVAFFSSPYIGNWLDPPEEGLYETKGWNGFEIWWHNWYPWSLILFILAGLCLLLVVWILVKRLWILKNKMHTVFFVDNDQQSVPHGSLLFPSIPKKEGYAFRGWYKDSACTEPWKSTDRVKHDLTLYPLWVKES